MNKSGKNYFKFKPYDDLDIIELICMLVQPVLIRTKFLLLDIKKKHISI